MGNNTSYPGCQRLHAPHPDDRPKAGETSGQHEANEMSKPVLRSFRSFRAVRSFCQPSAGRLDGEHILSSGTQGNQPTKNKHEYNHLYTTTLRSARALGAITQF